MGLLGSLARRTGAAALYGSGRLVSVVVPDSVTPWNLRRTATKTTGSLIGLGLSAYRKSSRKKKATKKRSPGSGRTLARSPKTSSKRGWLSLFGLGTSNPKSRTAAPMVLVTSAPGSTGSTRRPAARGPRPSTTKGLANLSRRTGNIATQAHPVVLIQSPVANEPLSLIHI